MSRRAIARPAIRRVVSADCPGLERLALVADRRDLVPVGEALRGYVTGWASVRNPDDRLQPDSRSGHRPSVRPP